MSVTRRKLLAVGGGAVLSMAAGCSSLSTGNESDTPTPEQPITARLLGPDTDRLLFERAELAAVGSVTENDDWFSLPVTLTGEATDHIVDVFQSVGVDDDPSSFEVAMFEDEEETTRFGLSAELVSAVMASDWDGEFRLVFDQRSTATSIQRTLACGTETDSCDR